MKILEVRKPEDKYHIEGSNIFLLRSNLKEFIPAITKTSDISIGFIDNRESRTLHDIELAADFINECVEFYLEAKEKEKEKEMNHNKNGRVVNVEASTDLTTPDTPKQPPNPEVVRQVRESRIIVGRSLDEICVKANNFLENGWDLGIPPTVMSPDPHHPCVYATVYRYINSKLHEVDPDLGF